ncbi:MAG TPA: S49 family peptidase [Alphaproteobacteria bacterium]
MRDLSLVATRVLNAPLLAHPGKAEVVAAVLLGRNGVEVNVEASAFASAPAPAMGPLQERRLVAWCDAERRPYLFDEQSGIAVIEVIGSLAHRQGSVGAYSGVMGYDWLGAQLDAAIEADDARALVFDLHTPGGEVDGAFQLADRIAAARGVKPMVAVVDEMAFSAGYLLAAACDEIWLASDVSQVGSVGVVWVHFSFEEFLAGAGIKPTIVQAGARKADGNPFQELPEEVRDLVQAKVDAVYDQFVSRVAAWRGMDEAAVRATEAGIYMGREALGVGFADGIADPSEMFAALAAEVNPTPAVRAV